VSHSESLRSAGVEALIEQLREEGIVRGQAEAARILGEAESRARWIVAQAEAEAEQHREDARRAAARFEEAARQGLEIASRDVLLRLKTALAGLFHQELRRQIQQELSAPEVLEKLILILAGRLRPALDAVAELEILLPQRAVDLEDLRRDPADLAGGELMRLSRRIARDMLREGVTLDVSPDIAAGFRIRLLDQVELEFTDETVSELLLAHLQPRFRAMLEGIVK
jgi:V/A-type H+-transporting ATPase subunit E